MEDATPQPEKRATTVIDQYVSITKHITDKLSALFEELFVTCPLWLLQAVHRSLRTKGVPVITKMDESKRMIALYEHNFMVCQMNVSAGSHDIVVDGKSVRVSTDTTTVYESGSSDDITRMRCVSLVVKETYVAGGEWSDLHHVDAILRLQKFYADLKETIGVSILPPECNTLLPRSLAALIPMFNALPALVSNVVFEPEFLVAFEFAKKQSKCGHVACYLQTEDCFYFRCKLCNEWTTRNDGTFCVVPEEIVPFYFPQIFPCVLPQSKWELIAFVSERISTSMVKLGIVVQKKNLLFPCDEEYHTNEYIAMHRDTKKIKKFLVRGGKTELKTYPPMFEFVGGSSVIRTSHSKNSIIVDDWPSAGVMMWMEKYGCAKYGMGGFYTLYPKKELYLDSGEWWSVSRTATNISFLMTALEECLECGVSQDIFLCSLTRNGAGGKSTCVCIPVFSPGKVSLLRSVYKYCIGNEGDFSHLDYPHDLRMQHFVNVLVPGLLVSPLMQVMAFFALASDFAMPLDVYVPLCKSWQRLIGKDHLKGPAKSRLNALKTDRDRIKMEDPSVASLVAGGISLESYLQLRHSYVYAEDGTLVSDGGEVARGDGETRFVLTKLMSFEAQTLFRCCNTDDEHIIGGTDTGLHVKNETYAKDFCTVLAVCVGNSTKERNYSCGMIPSLSALEYAAGEPPCVLSLLRDHMELMCAVATSKSLVDALQLVQEVDSAHVLYCHTCGMRLNNGTNCVDCACYSTKLLRWSDLFEKNLPVEKSTDMLVVLALCDLIAPPQPLFAKVLKESAFGVLMDHLYGVEIFGLGMGFELMNPEMSVTQLMARCIWESYQGDVCKCKMPMDCYGGKCGQSTCVRFNFYTIICSLVSSGKLKVTDFVYFATNGKTLPSETNIKLVVEPGNGLISSSTCVGLVRLRWQTKTYEERLNDLGDGIRMGMTVMGLV